jgi:hypothetical protein
VVAFKEIKILIAGELTDAIQVVKMKMQDIMRAVDVGKPFISLSLNLRELNKFEARRPGWL